MIKKYWYNIWLLIDIEVVDKTIVPRDRSNVMYYYYQGKKREWYLIVFEPEDQVTYFEQHTSVVSTVQDEKKDKYLMIAPKSTGFSFRRCTWDTS